MGLKVSGKLAPETLKPAPVTVAPLRVTDDVPGHVRVNDCVAGEFKSTLPKDMLLALILNVCTDTPSCKTKVSAAPPALAVRVAVCGVMTEDTVAVKLALVAPAGTVIETGKVTALLLLVRLAVNPPLAAAEVNVKVQLSVPATVIDPLMQLSELKVGALAAVAVPVPFKLTDSVGLASELVVIINCPVAAPVAAGEKLMFSA